MPRYRIQLPDGQRFDAHGSLTQIRTAHPDAVITHRVVLDASGRGELAPLTGQQKLDAEPVRGVSGENDADGMAALDAASEPPKRGRGGHAR